MSSTPNTVNILQPAPYVQLPLASAITGYSVKAMQRKIEEGHWVEGQEYIKAPDGHILISIKGYASWAERGQALKSATRRSASRSRSTARRSEEPSS